MNKDVVKRIIIENQERIPGLKVYNREITFENDANYILTGQRRAGKTFLLYHRIQSLIDNGHNRQEILYINFEDERLLEFKAEHFDLILDCYKELFKARPFLFFDEIQNITGWEKFVRRLADTQYNIFITGSNATMLSREMASSLGGRFLVKEIETLSFSEFLTFNNIISNENFEYSEQRFEIIKQFHEWFYFGGFPELMKYQDKKEYLNTIFQKVFLGDIVSRYQIRNKFALNLMIKKLAESTMDEVSFNRIKNIIQSTGVKVGTSTLIDYLDYLKDSFLVRGVENYNKKISERETKKKYYFRDHGLLGLFLHEPESILLETIVFNHLIKTHQKNLYYIRDKYEVDFYVDGEQLIQVSYNLTFETTRKRKIQSLLKAKQQVRANKLFIITHDHQETINENGEEIAIIPIWKWILTVTN